MEVIPPSQPQHIARDNGPQGLLGLKLTNSGLWWITQLLIPGLLAWTSGFGLERVLQSDVYNTLSGRR